MKWVLAAVPVLGFGDLQHFSLEIEKAHRFLGGFGRARTFGRIALRQAEQLNQAAATYSGTQR